MMSCVAVKVVVDDDGKSSSGRPTRLHIYKKTSQQTRRPGSARISMPEK